MMFGCGRPGCLNVSSSSAAYLMLYGGACGWAGGETYEHKTDDDRETRDLISQGEVQSANCHYSVLLW